MIKIEVEVSPEIVNKFGVEALQQRLQRTIELEELAILAQKINREVKAAGLDYTTLVERAREEAWQELKEKYLKKHLE